MDFLRWFLKEIVAYFTTEWAHRGHAAHANRRTPGDPHPTSVTFGWGSKLLGFLACAITVPLAMITGFSALMGHPVTGEWIVAPFFGATAIWLSISFYDQFVRLVEWNETGVRFRKWNGERLVPWDEIVGIEEKSHPPHIRIAFRDGTGFGISETMQNSRYFIAMLERRLVPDPDEHPPGSKRRKRRRRAKAQTPGASQV